jgi:acyl-homoserine-lactone acylase
MSRTRLTIFATALIIALILSAALILPGRGPGMTLEQAQADAAAHASARIVRNEFGIPSIYGDSDADTAFGLAYAHAEDDWQTIQGMLVAARGTMARYQGQDAAPIDYLVQLFRIRETVDARYQTELTVQTRAMLDGYARGLNLYATEHPDETWDAVLPIRGEDIVSGFVLRTPFMYGLDGALGELFGVERQHSISLSDSETAFQMIEGAQLPFGSNALAVAPDRSDDGATRLLINSHQPFEGPVAWYEASLWSGEGWNMTGATFPGAPLILHGYSRELGWAHTVNKPDLADIYVLETDGDRYLLDGEWLELEHATARLDVRIWGPIRWTVSRDLWWSRHGPVVRTEHGDYAIRYSGNDQVGAVEQWYQMNRATDFDSWMTAMNRNAIPSLNAVYADASGHIAYVYNARMPDRIEGYDWTQYLPGDRSELIWDSYHPLSSMPIYVDPQSGWLLSTNQTPFDVTDEGSNLSRTDYSATFGIPPRYSNRALRALPLLRVEETISREDILRVKFDNVYAREGAVGRLVAEILAMDMSDDPELEVARQSLAQWDLATNISNRHAALGVLTAIRCVGNLHTDDPWLMDPRQAFAAAAAELQDNFGRLDPEWGEVNRMVRGVVDIPVDGGPDVMRAIYGAHQSLGEDGRIHAAAGDTSIMLVEWAADGTLTADAIHQYGSATLDATSPHYADQVQMFADHDWRSLRSDMPDQGYHPANRE